MFKDPQTQAAAILGMNPGLKNNVKKKTVLLRVVRFHDRDCYEIETTLLPESFANLLKALPQNMKQYFPVKERLLIDKQTYLTQKQESFSANGDSLTKIEFQEIAYQSDMTEDIFQIPQGFEIKTPNGIKEYISELQKMMPEIIEPQYEKVSPSFYYQVPERVIVAPPKRFTEPPPRKGRGEKYMPQSPSSLLPRLIVPAASVLIILFMSLLRYFYIRKRG
ncbi:MAG: hypothetical protein LBJ67_10030 [Planctomycetaceae bacterium]|nr:hypothetical protein [Planctomycetaceae bacterium]